MQNKIFEAALGITEPWFIQGVDFDAGQKALSIHIDFIADSRFAYSGIEGAHPVHDNLAAHGGDVRQINSASIDMSPAFIKGVSDHLPNAHITFDKFHVIAHPSAAMDKMRRIEQKTDSELKGLRWALLKDRSNLSASQFTDLDALIAHVTTKRTAKAWLNREQLRDILDRKQINVVSALLWQWCTNVMRSKVEPMKEVAKMIRNHFDESWAHPANQLLP